MTLKASPSDAIKGRTLNLTLYSGLGAAITAAITVFNDSFKAIFPDLSGSELADAKLTLLIAVIAAFTLIAVADLLARAWATTANGRLIVTPMPGTPTAKTVDGEKFKIAAMRVKAGAPDGVEYLMVEAGREPTWEPAAKVRLLDT